MKTGWITLLAAMPVATMVAQAPYDYAANCRAWPAVHGPNSVGTIEFEVTDSLRSSQYAPVPTPVRRIYVRAWYPAADVGTSPPRLYFTGAETTVLMSEILGLLGRPRDAMRGCGKLRTNGHEGARVAAGRFPVVTFNHGFASHALQNTALFEHLAANGYVVLTLGHPYETAGIVYPNGDSVMMSRQLYKDLEMMASLPASTQGRMTDRMPLRLRAAAAYVEAIRHSSFGQLPAVWREDTYFVLDRLKASAVPSEAMPLTVAIDHERRAHLGMSFGGYIAAMTAQGDPRARAAANLDGGSWTYELIDADVRTPFLMLNSDVTYSRRFLAARRVPVPPGMYLGPRGPRMPTSGDIAYERVAAAGARADIYRIVVPDVMHEGFMDNPALVQDTVMRVRMGDSAAVAETIEVQNDVVLGFLDRYVNNRPNRFPREVLMRHPALVVLRRGPSTISRGAAKGRRPRE